MDEASWNGTVGEVIDSSGSSNNGKATTNDGSGTKPNTSSDARFSRAGSFSTQSPNNSQFVLVPANASFQLTTAVTVCSWDKPDQTSGNNIILLNATFGGATYYSLTTFNASDDFSVFFVCIVQNFSFEITNPGTH